MTSLAAATLSKLQTPRAGHGQFAFESAAWQAELYLLAGDFPFRGNHGYYRSLERASMGGCWRNALNYSDLRLTDVKTNGRTSAARKNEPVMQIRSSASESLQATSHASAGVLVV